MSLTRGFTPAQFRDSFLGVVGPQTVTPTPSSTTSGSFTKVSGISLPGAITSDIVFVQLVTPSSGVIVEGQITAANTLELIFYNISGSTYNPGVPVSVLVLALRPRVS